MKEPDWENAPEGATHYRPSLRGWYRQIDKAYEWVGMGWVLIGNDLGEFRWSSDLVERQSASRRGERLPPVGTVCEHEGTAESRHPWIEVVILAHTQARGFDVAVFQYGDTISHSSARYFRPILTPTQLAAEEREAAIEEIEDMIAGFTYRKCAELVYDAVYRKGESKMEEKPIKQSHEREKAIESAIGMISLDYGDHWDYVRDAVEQLYDADMLKGESK